MNLVRNSMIALALAAAGAFGAVDSNLLAMMPADAKVISGIQIDQSKTSTFGKYVLGQFLNAEDPGLKKLVADTGFDPRRDLNEVVFATTGTADAMQFIAAGRGVFNPSKILAAAQAGGAVITTYGNYQILSPSGPANVNALAVAFLDGATALMGNPALVKASIDRRTGGQHLDSATVNKVVQLASANDAWFLSTVPVSDLFAGKIADPNMNQMMGGNLFQTVKSANGGVKFLPASIKFSGEALTRSKEDAQALADVIRFIAGLVQQNKNDPQAAQAATLLNTLQLITQDATIQLSLSIPEDLVEKMFMTTPQQQHKGPPRQVKKVAAVR